MIKMNYTKIKQEWQQEEEAKQEAEDNLKYLEAMKEINIEVYL